jgi:hypothetical protein
VQREIQRWLNNVAPVAVAIPEEPKETKADAAAASKPGPHARPLSGPAVPRSAERAIENDDLLGGNTRQPTNDAIAAKVLARGEPVPAPAGRADDFAWPRRDIAPVGSDPVVAATELPMTPMVADRGNSGAVSVAAATPSADSAGAPGQSLKPALRRGPRPPSYADMQQQGIYRPDYRRPPAQQPFTFQSLFGGGGSWFSWR